MRNLTYETVAYRDDLGDESAVKFIGFLTDALGKVPKEYREKATIEFESDYESSRVEVTIKYDRPKTDSEILEEKADDEARLRARQKEELERAVKALARLGVSSVSIKDGKASITTTETG